MIFQPVSKDDVTQLRSLAPWSAVLPTEPTTPQNKSMLRMIKPHLKYFLTTPLMILYDLYIPNPQLRYWLGHVVCVFLLFCSMAFNSVLVRGCVFDGEREDGQGVVHDIRYASLFINLWKSSPIQSTKNLVETLFPTNYTNWRMQVKPYGGPHIGLGPTPSATKTTLCLDDESSTNSAGENSDTYYEQQQQS